MDSKTTISNIQVNLKAMQKLTFTLDNNGFVKYGKNNLYPQELIRLYDEHPEHRAILNRKARYIWGKGLKAKNKADEIKVNAFIDNFNKKESLNKVGKKISLNTEIFNGQFIEVITNMQGAPIEMYFINSANCRLSEDGDTLYFCKDWTKPKYQREIKEILKWNDKEQQVGTFFIDFRYYSATANRLDSVYPITQYQSIVEDINTDIVISKTNSNMVNNGLSMGKIVNFFNGKPDDKTVSAIDRGIKGTYTGEDGEPVMIVHSEREDKAPEVIDVTPTDMAERFLYTSKRALKKVFAGHEMASELFNIKFDDSFLSSAPDLLTLQELFVKGYIEPRQNDLLEFLSYLSFIKTGEYLEMMFEPISLVGADLSNDPDLTLKERRLIKGLETEEPVKLQAQAVNDAINSLSPLVANKVLESMSEDEIRALASLPPRNAEIGVDGKPLVDANGMPIAATNNSNNNNANEHIKSMTRKQMNNMHGIKKDYDSGKASLEQSLLALKGFGLSEDEANIWLGVVTPKPTIMSKIKNLFSSNNNQVDSVLMSFESIGTIEDPTTYVVLKREKVKFKNQVDALKYERQIMKFADALVISIEQLDNAILNALKGNPILSIDELAELTKSDFVKVEESISRLIKNGLLESNSIGFKPTEKAIEKETKPIVSDEIYTVYKYELNDEKPSLKKGGSSRPFCKKLMSLNKEYSFEEIDGISLKGVGENVGGTNIWDFRGGYYTNPETKVVDPDCRHIWVAETRRRKAKK